MMTMADKDDGSTEQLRQLPRFVPSMSLDEDTIDAASHSSDAPLSARVARMENAIRAQETLLKGLGDQLATVIERLPQMVT